MIFAPGSDYWLQPLRKLAVFSLKLRNFKSQQKASFTDNRNWGNNIYTGIREPTEIFFNEIAHDGKLLMFY